MSPSYASGFQMPEDAPIYLFKQYTRMATKEASFTLFWKKMGNPLRDKHILVLKYLYQPQN